MDTPVHFPSSSSCVKAYFLQRKRLSATARASPSFAEIEAGMGSADAALVGIDEALALANETGLHATDVFLHRIRGEILLRLDPAKTESAEESFLAAIGIAHVRERFWHGSSAFHSRRMTLCRRGLLPTSAHCAGQRLLRVPYSFVTPP
jgi:predicted RNase H-like nuclease